MTGVIANCEHRLSINPMGKYLLQGIEKGIYGCCSSAGIVDLEQLLDHWVCKGFFVNCEEDQVVQRVIFVKCGPNGKYKMLKLSTLVVT